MYNRLKEYRWRANLSQKQLAIKADVNVLLIKRLEVNIKMGIGVENAIKLARALEVDIEDIFIV